MTELLSTFVWYELMTPDLETAERFYRQVVGWEVADAGMPGVDYRLAKIGPSVVAGLMATPPHAAGAPPFWFGYVGVADVDAAAQRLSELGGAVHRAPDDIPGVGRFAVVADPQGAVFSLFQADGQPPPSPPYMTPGTFGWHELHAGDWQAVEPFYAALFGWQKGTAMEMGPAGIYQIVTQGGRDLGALFSDAKAPRPHWLYYISVEDIDAAVGRVAESGGTVTDGPHPVPGEMWIAHVSDPQGARFALVGPRPRP